MLSNKCKENKRLRILPRVFGEIFSCVKKTRLTLRHMLLLSSCSQNSSNSFVLFSVVGLREPSRGFTYNLLLKLTSSLLFPPCGQMVGVNAQISHGLPVVMICLSGLPMVGRWEQSVPDAANKGTHFLQRI